MEKNEIVLFESKDGAVSLPVSMSADTVWLSLLQMAKLFGKDKTVIFRHVKNAIADGEIDPKVTSAKFAMVTQHGAIPGKTRVQEVDCYNLDVIISVGYRVKSQRGVEFRRWATSVLKEYLVHGYAVNRERIRQLGQTVEVMKRVANNLDTEQVLDVVQTYSAALDLLDGYDHQTIEKPKTNRRRTVPVFSEAQPAASSQGRLEAHRRPHACRAHRDDRRVQAAGERTDGQPRDDVSEVMFCFPQRRRGAERRRI